MSNFERVLEILREEVDYKTMKISSLRKKLEFYKDKLRNAKTQNQKLSAQNQISIINDVLKSKEDI